MVISLGNRMGKLSPNGERYMPSFVIYVLMSFVREDRCRSLNRTYHHNFFACEQSSLELLRYH